MTTQCFMVVEFQGDCWDKPGAIFEIETSGGVNEHLSPLYLRDHAQHRKPYMIVCPDGRWWPIDYRASNAEGWVVTGEAPHLTAQGSVDTGTYHGFLENGVLTDDLEGRTYDQPAEREVAS